MESLFPELASMVAKFLTPRDLAACCGVSVHWREVFGSNQIWKRFCDLEKEEYLRTTPCVVEPVFSIFHDNDSTLLSLSKWRLAFLRERHLWSNWRNGKFKTVEQINTMNGIYFERFVTNDFIVVPQSKSIELWDVRPNPPMRVDNLDIGDGRLYDGEIPHPAGIQTWLDMAGNGIVVLRSKTSIKILKVDVIEGTITLKYQFLSNTITQTPELICGNTPVSNENRTFDDFEVMIIKGKFCIGYFFDGKPNSFHIWDLESGIKIKQESCPTNPLKKARLAVVSSKTCDDVLVLGPFSWDSRPKKLQCRVYDVQNLRFLSFSHTCSRVVETGCAITNNFVALLDCEGNEFQNTDNVIRIFNYRTDQQMYTFEANHSVDLLAVLADACFIFRSWNVNGTGDNVIRFCSVFCSSGDVVKDVIGDNADYFEVRGNGLLEVDPDVNSLEEYWFWVINRFASFKADVIKSLLPRQFEGVNKACTKVSTVTPTAEYEEFDTIQITHFW